MKSKIIFLIVSVMLMQMLIPSSLAAPILTKDGDCKLAVVYVDATSDSTEINTARFAACALFARWTSTEDAKNTKDMLFSRIGENSEYKRYDSDPSRDLRNFIRAGKSTGSEKLNENGILKQLKTADYDLWFIVPQEAKDAFCNNQALFEQIKDPDRVMRAHVVFIGEADPAEPSEDSALAQYCAETEKADWIHLDKDYQNTSERGDGNRQVNTGYYFLAGLYGTPVNLPVEDDQVTIPQKGNVFLLYRDQGDKGVFPTLDSENSYDDDNSGDGIKVDIGEKNSYKYLGKLMRDAEPGTYSIPEASNKDVHVYYYPDLQNVHVEMDIPNKNDDGSINRGTVEINISISNAPRPDSFRVECRTALNGNDQIVEMRYDGENTWTGQRELTGSDSGEISLIPAAILTDAEGNLIGEWIGDEEKLQIENKKVKIIEDAPKELTLYYEKEQERNGKAEYKWDQFFDYNPEDGIQPKITNENEVTQSGYKINNSKNGFSIETDSSGSAPGETELELNCGDENVITVKIKARSITELADEITFEPESDESKPGNDLSFKAVISPETAKEYSTAGEQNSQFIGPEGMRFTVSKSNGKEVGSSYFKESDSENGSNGWEAKVVWNVPENQQSGEIKFEELIAARDNPDTEIKKEDISVTIENNPPKFKEDKSFTDKNVVADGVPVEWEGNSLLQSLFGAPAEISLLKEAFGTDKIYDLFEDDETPVVSVEVSIDPQIPGSEETQLWDNGKNSWIVTKNEDVPDVKVFPQLEPVNYTVTVKASDGVNDLEQSVAVNISSGAVRTVVIAAVCVVGVLLLLAIILVIIRVRKPSFENVNVRCLITTDEDMTQCTELMRKSEVVSLLRFGKKAAPLADVLTMAHQPPLSTENAEIADHISLLPSRHEEILVVYEKEALNQLGSHDKKEPVSAGSVYRLRLGNTYILIENT